jgi:hypothetical protein
MTDTVFAEAVTTPNTLLDMVKKGQVDVSQSPVGFFSQFDQDINEGMRFMSTTQNLMSHISEEFAQDDSYGSGLLPFVVMDDVILFHANPEKSYLAHNYGNYSDENIDGVMLGIVGTLYALNQLCIYHFQHKNTKWNEFYADKYHALRNWFYGNIDKIIENGTPDEVSAAKRASNAFFSLTD